MAKKNKSSETSTGTPPRLTHNPFAALTERSAAAQPAPTPSAEPAPPPATPAARTKKLLGRVVLRRETKHRGGKAVVVISGFASLAQFDAQATRELAQALKQQLGCGGTVEERGSEREIVLQGDRPAQVAELLRARGFRVDGVTS
jgi:translation initiation factor 1